MTVVGVAIMADRRRAALVADLAARLDVNPVVVWDRHNARWDTGRRALLAHRTRPHVTHWVVVQDDAVACRDLAAGVARLYDQKAPSDCPVGLYLGAGMPRAANVERAYRTAKQRGYRWVVMRRSPMWGVALVIPATHIEALVEHADRLRTPVYDGRIASYFRRRNIACWYPVPSLVDHRDKAENPSLINPKARAGRVAHEFIGTDWSPLDVDWDTGHVTG